MERRQGRFDKAVIAFREAIDLDPRNPLPISDLAETLSYTRQYTEAERIWDQLIGVVSDPRIPKLQKEYINAVQRTGDDTAYRSQLASLQDDDLILSARLSTALDHHEWDRAKELIARMKGKDDAAVFAFAARPVPVGCYSILIARLQGEEPDGQIGSETRELLNRRVQNSPDNSLLLSNLAVVDALLGRKDDAIAEAKRAVEMMPILQDALDGPSLELNLAVVYGWTGETDLAFEYLNRLAKMPYGLYYNDLKLRPYFEPLRSDPRFEKLLTELAP